VHFFSATPALDVTSGSTPMVDTDVGGGGVAAVGPDTTVWALASSPVDVDDSPMVRRVRATCSDVWKEMEEVKKVVGGKEVRVGAICNYCKSRLSAPSTGGTGHLRRHIKACKRKALAASPLVLSLICILMVMVMLDVFSTMLMLLGQSFII
jgi:hypothetical protein